MSLTIRRKTSASLVSGTFSSGGGYSTVPEPLFANQLQTSLVPQRGGGSLTPTFTRATTATVWGYGPTAVLGTDSPVLLTVASGEARFVGARRISEGVWSAVDANGVPLTTATSYTDASGPFGYLSEGARTNLLLQSRDMTNVAWTAGATMTVARTSIGVDGVANSANRLTAGAVTATNIITQLVTAAASSRTYSAYIKRITGTGPVRLSEDNFTGGTDISGSLVANQWVLVQFTASILNAVVGIKIDTNTDAIDVDMNQFEAGAFASSPIPTTTVAVTRNADVLTYPSAGNISGTVGSTYLEWTSANPSTAVQSQLISSATNRAFQYVETDVKLYAYDGTNLISGVALTLPSPTTIIKSVSAWGGVTGVVYANGVAGAATTFDGNFTPTATLGIGNTDIGTLQPFGTIRNVRIYPQALSAAKLTT